MQIGAYTVTRELGRGGMGVVYEVRHPEWPDAPLALKLIRQELADATTTARFQREAEVMARIDHPNVVRVRTLGMFDEQLYLVTDLVQGEPLSERMRRGALAPEEAARIVVALSKAIGAVHAEGVLHRDLKPDNVIVRPDGTPVLLDFGVALDLGAEKLTQTGAMIGTPAYMSPEQAAGERSRMGPASDVYALGAILFALLSGRAPFEGESGLVVAKKILTQEPRWPSSDDARVPIPLEAVLRKTMAKEPHQRYRSAEALGEDVERWLRGESPMAHESHQQQASRRRRPWIVLGAASLLAAGGAIAVAARAPSTPEPTASPRPRPSRRAARPKLDPAGELRRLDNVGGPRKVELARAFLAAFPTHTEAGRVRRDLLRAGLSTPVRMGEVPQTGQPWGRFVSASTVLVVPRLHAGSEGRPLLLWELGEPRGRPAGPTLKQSERKEMEFATLHQGQLVLGLAERGLLRFDPRLAVRGPDRSGHAARVHALAAQGEWLAIGFDDGAVSLRRGPELKAGPGVLGHVDLAGVHRPIQGLGFSADGSLLVTSSGDDHTVLRVWRTADGARVHEQEIELDEVHVLVPDPTRPGVLLAGTHDTNDLYLLDVSSGATVLRFDGSDLRAMSARGAHSSHLRDAVFSPDGSRIYSVSGVNGVDRSSELRVWDARSGKELAPPTRRPGLVLYSIALSPRGDQAVTLGQRVGKDVSVLELWQVDRPEPRR